MESDTTYTLLCFTAKGSTHIYIGVITGTVTPEPGFCLLVSQINAFLTHKQVRADGQSDSDAWS
jgi:hypothetical protein